MAESHLRALAVLLTLGAGLAAQAQTRVEVRVTFVSGRSVFLDQGRDAGLQAGDEVVLRPPGAGLLRARIDSVARSSARVELGEGPLPPSDTPGEVLIPSDRPRGAAASQSAPQSAPGHAPWPEPLPGGAGDAPLLAPVLGRRSGAPPAAFHGRLYATATDTWDRGSDRHNQYLFARAGADLWLDRPLGYSDELRFTGEYTRSDALLEDVPDVGENRFRLDRLAYGIGVRTTDPWFVQFGRFPQREVPELGLLDGLEGSLRLSPEWRVGASAGALPDAFRHGGDDDAAVAAFLRFQPTPAFDGTLAYQRTWHKSQQDRDLFVATADGALGHDLTWHGSAWVDWYHGDDQIKTHGLELTQLLATAGWRIDPDNGLSATFTRVRWPELRRDEFQSLVADRIRGSRVTTTSLSGWHRFDVHWRADGRIARFDSDQGDGVGGDARLSEYDVLAAGNQVALQFIYTAGTFQRGPGMRLSTSQALGSALLTLAYDVAWLRSRDLGGDVTLTQQMVSGTLDLPLWSGTYLSLNADQRFGDGQDAITIGGTFQVRF